MTTEKKVIIGIVVLSIFILVDGTVFLSSTSTSTAQVEVSQNAKAEISEKTYDWGKINFSGGNVTKTFVIKNSGTDTLKLTNIKTSCHCTKARVLINSESSPDFGMNSASAWIGEVSASKQASLEVIFDPAFHGQGGLGPINRLVNVETNDPNNRTVEFSLTGTVEKE